jgi:hypothetical protein
MLILFRQRRLTSLIVSLAILLNLCAPAISQAMSVLAADPLALEMCSATPAATAASGKRAPAGLPAHGIKHCMLCAVHAGGEAPPPAAPGLLTLLEGHGVCPAPPAALAQSALWPDAQPRGPPTTA